jgi:hypothetical protein
MTLAQVQATTNFVALLMFCWAGVIIGVALWFPKQANRAKTALSGMPWVCGATGVGLAIMIAIGIVLLGIPNPLARLVGAGLLLTLSALLCLGGAGVSLLMGDRISELSGAKTSFSALVRGSAVYSLSVGFPFIGWFLIAPLSIVFLLGAGLVGLWPRGKGTAPMMPPAPRPEYDLMERQGAI